MKKLVSAIFLLVFSFALFGAMLCVVPAFGVAKANDDVDVVILGQNITDEEATQFGGTVSDFTPMSNYSNGERMPGKSLVLNGVSTSLGRTTTISFEPSVPNFLASSSNESVYFWLYLPKRFSTGITFVLSDESGNVSMTWTVDKDKLLTDDEKSAEGIAVPGWRSVELKFSALNVEPVVDFAQFCKFEISYTESVAPYVYSIVVDKSTSLSSDYYVAPGSEQGYNVVATSAQFSNLFVGCMVGDSITMPKFNECLKYAWIEKTFLNIASGATVAFPAGVYLANDSLVEISTDFNANWKLKLSTPSTSRTYVFGEKVGNFTEAGEYSLNLVLESNISGTVYTFAESGELVFEVKEKGTGLWFENITYTIDDKYDYVLNFYLDRTTWQILNKEDISISVSNEKNLEIVSYDYDNGSGIGYIKVRGKKSGKAVVKVSSECVRNVATGGSNKEYFEAATTVNVQKSSTSSSNKTMIIVLCSILGGLLIGGGAAAVVTIVKHNKMGIR